ncbi:uncharacterized protein LOC121386237 isoform X2 [Gigantopelta aegis]|uniref:uncharacterized protein LOC121386237 isoform X2 n=1 Tax=Gigantopelta aegis TaxID=1735272 RepID=UPI001B887D2C|nr:uncharacterized protein LOC121386237 isoform X2 [Gigantopelta aegis]
MSNCDHEDRSSNAVFSVVLVLLLGSASGLEIALHGSPPAVVVGSSYRLSCLIPDTDNTTGDSTFFRGVTAMCFLRQSPGGCRTGSIHWPGYSCDCPSVASQRRVYTLNISSLNEVDGKRWGCLYRRVNSNFVTIPVRYPPSVTSFTINARSDSVTTVKEGAPVSLTCDVRSDPVSTVQLTKGSQKLYDPRQSGAEYNWTAGCLDSGEYTCTADNGIQPSDSRTLNMAVKCSPRLDHRHVNQALMHLAHVKDNVTLRVFTIANPRPIFKWRKLHNNVEYRLASSAPTTSTTSTAVGEYTLVNVNDSGAYRVYVYNGVESPLVVDFTVSVVEQDTNTEEKQTPLDYDDVAISESSTMYWVIPSTFVFVFCVAIVVVVYRRSRNNKEINTDQSNSGHEYNEPYEIDSLHLPAPAVGISQPAHVYDHLGSRQRSDYRSLDRLTRVRCQTDGEDTNPTRMPIPCGDTRRKPSYRALVYGQDARRSLWNPSWLPNVAEYERNSVQVPFLDENVGWNTRNPSWVLFREEDVRPMSWNPARM